jgi:hypothetical protein
MGGKFEKGLFIWPDGRKQDSAEAIREHLAEQKWTTRSRAMTTTS